jgi:hypothetical protein
MQEGNIWCVDVPEKNTNYILHLTQEKFKGTFKEKFMPHSHGISKVNTRVNDPTSPPQSLHWPTVGWGCPSICFWRLPSHVHPSANFQTAFLAQTLEPCHKQITYHVRTLIRHNYKLYPHKFCVMLCEVNTVQTLSLLPEHYLLKGQHQYMQVWVPPMIHSIHMQLLSASSLVFLNLAL